MQVYMDNGAGKPVDPRVIEEMNKHHTETYGNPSKFSQFMEESKNPKSKKMKSLWIAQ